MNKQKKEEEINKLLKTNIDEADDKEDGAVVGNNVTQDGRPERCRALEKQRVGEA